MTTTTARATPEAIRHALAHHTGSVTFYRAGPLYPGVLYTEGVKHLAELCGAHWLIDAIASHIATSRRVRAEPFQIWTLRQLDPMEPYVIEEGTEEGATWRLDCRTDGAPYGHEIARQDIAYSDFPLDSIEVWVGVNEYEAEPRMGATECRPVGWTLYLPSEH
jgi:hypothetical protein